MEIRHRIKSVCILVFLAHVTQLSAITVIINWETKRKSRRERAELGALKDHLNELRFPDVLHVYTVNWFVLYYSNIMKLGHCCWTSRDLQYFPQ